VHQKRRNNIMTIKEVNRMKSEGFEKFSKTELNEGLVQVNVTKNILTDLEKDIKDALQSKLSVGEQLTLDFGSNEYTSKLVEDVEISFDLSDEDLLNLCKKVNIFYVDQKANKTALKKAFTTGKLEKDIQDHVKTISQSVLKFSKKSSKKGKEVEE
jgi:homospermidine synthase